MEFFMKNRMLNSFWFKIILVQILFTSVGWASFELRPFVVRLQASQGQLTGFVDVQTTQSLKPVAVEISVHERSINMEGQEEAETPETQDIVVYPSQLVVYPGKKVRVQVAWAGKQAPVADIAYVLLAREVPIEGQTENNTSVNLGVNTMIQYRGVVAVETGGKGNLRTISLERDKETEKVELIVENTGSGRVPMEGFYLIIRGQPYKNLGGQGNSIMPGDRRRFLLDLPYLPSRDEISFGAE